MPSIVCSVCQCEINLELNHLAAAACGHTFHSNCLNEWLQKGSKTCPVCRKATKSSLALFIDFATEDQPSTNSGSSTDFLRCRVDSLDFQLKLKEEERKKLEEKATMLEQNKKDLRLEAKRLENQYKSELDKRKSLESQIQYVTKELSTATGFRDEAVRLRAQLESLKSAKLLLQGTEEDVEDIMSSYSDKSDEMRSLATFCVMLKKELVKSQDSKGSRIEELNRAQTENTTLRRRVKSLEKRMEELENDISRVDAENMKLLRKIDALRGKRPVAFPDQLNDSVASISSESPVFLDLPVKKKRNTDKDSSPAGTVRQIDELRGKRRLPFPDRLDDSLASSSSGSLRNSDENSSPADAIHEGSLKIRRPRVQLDTEEMDLDSTSSSSQTTSSPSSLRSKTLQASSSHNPSRSDIDLNHLSIMKKRPVLSPKKTRDSDINFDGMGGSSRPDIFPKPKGPKSLMKSVKIKSGNTVKLAKILDFITID